MPFSPLRTKRPIVCQVWNPATRVAVGHWVAISATLSQLNVHRATMLIGRRDQKWGVSFCAPWSTGDASGTIRLCFDRPHAALAPPDASDSRSCSLLVALAF